MSRAILGLRSAALSSPVPRFIRFSIVTAPLFCAVAVPIAPIVLIENAAVPASAARLVAAHAMAVGLSVPAFAVPL